MGSPGQGVESLQETGEERVGSEILRWWEWGENNRKICLQIFILHNILQIEKAQRSGAETGRSWKFRPTPRWKSR